MWQGMWQGNVVKTGFAGHEVDSTRISHLVSHSAADELGFSIARPRPQPLQLQRVWRGTPRALVHHLQGAPHCKAAAHTRPTNPSVTFPNAWCIMT